MFQVSYIHILSHQLFPLELGFALYREIKASM